MFKKLSSFRFPVLVGGLEIPSLNHNHTGNLHITLCLPLTPTQFQMVMIPLLHLPQWPSASHKMQTQKIWFVHLLLN